MRALLLHSSVLTVGLVVASCSGPGTTTVASVGGSSGVGGATGAGGSTADTGGATSGDAQGGDAAGGVPGTGGAKTGGAPGVGGATSTINCSGTMPTGGTVHTGNTQGGAGSLAWSLWSNGTGGNITTFSTTAFSASWSNSGDFLARMGLEWGNSPKPYEQYGTITAQFAETRTGTGGGFSYVGIYGWSTNPCVEYYIVDDSYNTMPVNPGNDTNKGTATIDGGTYNLWLRNTTGTGGNRCGSTVTNWAQYYSIRQKARQCGQISITEHFNAWKAAGMTLGNMLEAKIIVETGGGTGSINFTTANVTAK